MNSQPLVSVLVRTKDRKILLQSALDSICRQKYPAIEIIIVNDGGEDFASDIQPSKQIRWINNEGSLGRSHAANLALAESGGKYCLFLDDDDNIDPDHISNLVNALNDNPAYKLAYSAVRIESNGITEESPTFVFPYDSIRLMVENYIPIHAVLFSREIIDEAFCFDPAFDRFEDWDFWLQIAEQHSFLYVDICTATYHVDNNSGFGVKVNEPDDMARYRAEIYKKWLPRWPDEKVLQLFNRSREFPRIEALEATIKGLNNEINNKTEFLAEQNSLIKEKDKKILAQQKALTELRAAKTDLNKSQHELGVRQKQNQSLVEELQVVYNSRSWKLTRPLRLITRMRWFIRNEGVGGLFSRLKFRLQPRFHSVKKIKARPPVSTTIGPLVFPEPDHPEISIVIPVYNNYQYTFHCLQSILDTSESKSFEIIVVDDKSTDKTRKMLKGISGIKVIHNQKNMGFIESCNAGAKAAQGEFLVILNNDTEVRTGWLTALHNTFSDFPDAGLVGARLVFADGTLQEAGGIVWNDGSAWNFGRGDDPNKPEYAYCRETDYCSGACLMIRGEDFNSLGGFDTHYIPAYYEDTDLAFKIRQLGKKVYYQPNATIIHFEGITSGTDASSGIKKYQQINHEKFFTRWKDVLKQHRPNGRLPELEKERYVEKRILVIDARVLMPDHDSGSLRMFSILRILQSMGYKVSFIPANLQYHESYTPPMQALGIECHYLPYVRSVSQYLENFGEQYDAVILSRADTAEKIIDQVKQFCPNAKILFDTVDLHFLREQREAELANDPSLKESATERKIQELTIARKADTTLVVSPVELELFQQEAPDVKINLLSNVHQIYDSATTFNERRDILFIGGFEHPPNIDAMYWFLDEIYPLLQKENPDINLHIVGGHVPSQLQAKASEQIKFLGFVSDIKPLFDSVKLSIAPLRYGAGVKGKINTSMSYGVPVVATTMAAEGMNLTHEQDVLIADEPEGFAREILRLYEDEKLWQLLSNAGKQNIERHFSFALAEEQLRAVLSP